MNTVTVTVTLVRSNATQDVFKITFTDGSSGYIRRTRGEYTPEDIAQEYQ